MRNLTLKHAIYEASRHEKGKGLKHFPRVQHLHAREN